MANIITDTKRLGQLIRIIGQRGPQWTEMVQTAAVSATIIARQHGQIGPINSLLKAMAGAPANTHKLLTAWLYRNAPIAPLSDALRKDYEAMQRGETVKFSKPSARKVAEWTPDADLLNDKWDAKPEKAKEAPVSWDAAKAVEGLAKRLTTAAESGLTITHKEDAIKALEALLASLKA